MASPCAPYACPDLSGRWSAVQKTGRRAEACAEAKEAQLATPSPCARPCPYLVHDLPIWPVDGQVLARQRLSMRRRVFALNTSGMRFYPNRRRDHCLPRFSLAMAHAREHELRGFPHSSMIDASTLSPCHTLWRLVGCLGIVCATAASATWLGTVVGLR